MPEKRYNAEAIIHKLTVADVLLGQGKTVREVCKVLGFTDQTCYRCRRVTKASVVDARKPLI